MQISNEIIKVLEYLCEKVGVTIDWTSNNILPYIEQLCEKFIVWQINTSILWIGIMCSITILALVSAIIIYNVNPWDGFEWFFFAIILVIAIVITSVQLYDIIECKTFPEKAIYDYVQYYIINNR